MGTSVSPWYEVNGEFACASIFQSQWSYDMNLMLGQELTLVHFSAQPKPLSSLTLSKAPSISSRKCLR
jgi:hypothetical protein